MGIVRRIQAMIREQEISREQKRAREQAEKDEQANSDSRVAAPNQADADDLATERNQAQKQGETRNQDEGRNQADGEEQPDSHRPTTAPGQPQAPNQPQAHSHTDSAVRDVPLCDSLAVNPQVISAMRAGMPVDGAVSRVGELFKVLGDGTRLRILFALLDSEPCVCDLTRLLDMTTSAVSHQLRVLRQAHLIGFRREGKQVFYSLLDDHVRTLLQQGLEHVLEPEAL